MGWSLPVRQTNRRFHTWSVVFKMKGDYVVHVKHNWLQNGKQRRQRKRLQQGLLLWQQLQISEFTSGIKMCSHISIKHNAKLVINKHVRTVTIYFYFQE